MCLWITVGTATYRGQSVWARWSGLTVLLRSHALPVFLAPTYTTASYTTPSIAAVVQKTVLKVGFLLRLAVVVSHLRFTRDRCHSPAVLGCNSSFCIINANTSCHSSSMSKKEISRTELYEYIKNVWFGHAGACMSSARPFGCAFNRVHLPWGRPIKSHL